MQGCLVQLFTSVINCCVDKLISVILSVTVHGNHIRHILIVIKRA